MITESIKAHAETGYKYGRNILRYEDRSEYARKTYKQILDSAEQNHPTEDQFSENSRVDNLNLNPEDALDLVGKDHHDQYNDDVGA